MGNKLDMDEEKLVTGHTLMRALTFAMQDEDGLAMLVNNDATIALLLPIIVLETWEHINEAIKEKEEEEENNGKTEN